MNMIEMTQDEYEIFKAKSIKRRADYHEIEADLNSEEAFQKASEEFSKYCLQGLQTENQFFYNLTLENKVAGYIWFAIRERNRKKRVFINDIFVEEPFRGRGLSKFMMSWLERKANELGFKEIGLHVLGDNLVARGLYEKMGYSITNLDMAKTL